LPTSVLLELPTLSGPTMVIALTSPPAAPPYVPNPPALPPHAERSRRRRPRRLHRWSPTIPTHHAWRRPISRSTVALARRAQRKLGRTQPPRWFQDRRYRSAARGRPTQASSTSSYVCLWLLRVQTVSTASRQQADAK
jgi:hypothetical protein